MKNKLKSDKKLTEVEVCEQEDMEMETRLKRIIEWHCTTCRTLVYKFKKIRFRPRVLDYSKWTSKNNYRKYDS